MQGCDVLPTVGFSFLFFFSSSSSLRRLELMSGEQRLHRVRSTYVEAIF